MNNRWSQIKYAFFKDWESDIKENGEVGGEQIIGSGEGNTFIYRPVVLCQVSFASYPELSCGTWIILRLGILLESSENFRNTKTSDNAQYNLQSRVVAPMLTVPTLRKLAADQRSPLSESFWASKGKTIFMLIASILEEVNQNRSRLAHFLQ